ncbi:MAG: phosphoribosylaminoimidazolesuccinocarboxamide synthase [Candidatus Micrarchaeota archaeon]|nr:phosphoribosylaminoimidazolesuccinocarboxamide synthase [Candidatus Micrarchaeota archaeon]
MTGNVSNAYYRIELEYPLFKSGKVRDNYFFKGNILMVASDRLSAFDVVFPQPIPKKGIVLTQMSLFWFNKFKKYKNHLLKLPKEVSEYKNSDLQLPYRSMYVKKAFPIMIEAVVRGYLAGSGYKEYKQSGKVCGIELEPGLENGSKLKEPIFTPATKAIVGHDINITEKEAEEIVYHNTGDKEIYHKLKKISIEIYKSAHEYALEKGIILADTKFEFGIDSDGELILIDEILTPDSSRFWDKQTYSVGKEQKSFDKQYVRDYVEKINWNKQPPAPNLPDEIIANTTKKYIEAYEKLTGKKFEW